MAFNILGEAAELCFDPHFAPIQRFINGVSESLGEDITLMRDLEGRFTLSFGGVTTLGERYIHVSWERLWYWSRRQLIAFPAELIGLSLSIPAKTPEGVKRHAQR